MPDIETTPDFWDCECESGYIHPRRLRQCPECGAYAEEQPDSRIAEVKTSGFTVDEASPMTETAPKLEPKVLRQEESIFETWNVYDDWFCRDFKPKTIQQVFDAVREALKAYDDPENGPMIDDYFHIDVEQRYARSEPAVKPWPTGARIAVFAVTGGSEGHYVHVEALEDGKHENLFLGKTFRGMDHAHEIVRALSKILMV